MKVKKMSQRPLKLPEVQKLAITGKKKRDLSKVTTKEFLEQDFESDTDSDIYDSDEKDKNTDDENSERPDSDSDSESNLNPAEYKRSLIKLQDTDPDFYEYLKENDQDLLDLEVSDDGDDDNYSVDSDDRHISNKNLKVASDNSDSQSEEADDNCEKITMQLLKVWQQEIQTDKSSVTIKRVVEAFHAALNSIAVSRDTTTRYKVEGSATFNGVMQLCITHLPDALRRYLKLDPESQEAHKSKRFNKIQEILKLYLSDLIKLLQTVASSNNAVLIVLLKHLHQVWPYTQSFSSLSKPLLRILLKLWSTAEETVCVIAFMNILHIATNKEFVLEKLLETMYEKYGQNTKFVSPKTLPRINFMRHSLVEIYLLDHNISYSHAFLHIRQLAIDLKNAVTLKNKENLQAVYNWQYINFLRFWTELITKARDKLESLLYPLVQIIIGTIKINPTVQYYPLRFHCLKMLITISKETGTFIPIMPFFLEILDSYDFNKRHKATMQPISFDCLLRISKSQLVENGFKDSIIETIYQLILEHAASESYRIYFPDLYISCIIQLKEFLKKCHVTIYCKKMKQLLSVIEENRTYIETERAKAAIDLQNMAKIINWENRIKTDGTAIAKFYASCIKHRESQNLKFLTKNEKEFNVPVERKSVKHKLDEQSAEDSEEESEFEFQMKETESEIRAERRLNKKKINKNKKKK
ncbi:nucleolar complex protein 2-like isoform X1 [Temnothorax longispinosus]|uniref:Nucleolar complex protein 2-like protein n=1 Tax=Temnothorax longispinosus TaxID=300112 RepID=A0A4S2JT05_9HYME|nr:Nucleolar complex protein 2-like protein [Temnothorax longispinosus]